MAEEFVAKEAKPGLLIFLAAIVIGAAVNSILTFLTLFICMPCLFSDLVGGSITVWIAKKLSGQRGQVSFGAAAFSSFLSGFLSTVLFGLLAALGTAGFFSILGLSSGSIEAALSAGLIGTLLGGVYGLGFIILLGIIKAVISAVAGVLTANLDKT